MSKLLPVVSSAAMTTFCAERLDGPDGSNHYLWLDGNQKITAGNGSYAEPRPNAFSLVQIEDCPGSTPTCRIACLASFHKVLTADLRYVSLRDIGVGDRLVSFDETPRPGERRTRFRTGTVQAVRHRNAPVFAVRLQSGKTFYVTEDHRWLVRRPDASGTRLWVRTDELRPSYHNAVRLLDEWETATSYEAGWLSGMYDGEGCFYVNDDIMQLTLSQKAGLVLDRARAAVVSVLGEQSYQSCAQTRDVWQLRLAGGRTQIAKALGILRPTRLLPKFNPEMLGEAWTASVDMVVSVEACGTEEITEIAIDTETMVVEGFAHHNCYVHGLEAAAKTTHDLYRHNSRTLREIFAAPDGVGYSADQPAGRWWARRLGAWIEEHARGGFRWHVSGDLFDPTYAWWVARVVECSPSVRHWIYTRSHAMSAAFVGVSNITVNYSVDVDNYETAKAYAAAHAAIGEPVRLCYMVTGDGHVPSDLPPGSVIFPDYSLRGSRGDTPNDQRASSSWWQSLTGEHRRMVCGVDFYGKSEKMRCGPCLKCIEPVKGTR